LKKEKFLQAEKYVNWKNCDKKHIRWLLNCNCSFDAICSNLKTTAQFMAIWPTVPPTNAIDKFDPLRKMLNKCVKRSN
jgi:hypothetical protein